jgi:hypothetical protein
MKHHNPQTKTTMGTSGDKVRLDKARAGVAQILTVEQLWEQTLTPARTTWQLKEIVVPGATALRVVVPPIMSKGRYLLNIYVASDVANLRTEFFRGYLPSTKKFISTAAAPGTTAITSVWLDSRDAGKTLWLSIFPKEKQSSTLKISMELTKK